MKVPREDCNTGPLAHFLIFRGRQKWQHQTLSCARRFNLARNRSVEQFRKALLRA